MARGRKPEIPVAKLKPNISVGTGITRSKPITNSEHTTRGGQASRSILGLIPPPSRSRAISALVAPSSISRTKVKGIDGTTPNPTDNFFSKRDIVGPSQVQRASIDPISSGGVVRSKSITKEVQPTKVVSAVGQSKSFPPRRTLTFSDL